ncbi:MAG: helix-turn-helix transcriptional regulator [Bacilli bacterium]
MLSEKLKKYRLDNNLTQEEFAAKLFVTRNAVSKWENDNGYPNIETLKDIAKLLNTTIDELLGEDDVKSIAIDTNDKLNKYKNYVSNILVFILYDLVGILIPYLIFLVDPTSVMLYCLFIAPITFIILGLSTPFYNKNVTNSFIAGALAIIPILIFFEAETQIVIYPWEILYYILFISFYFVMLMILKVNLKNNINKIVREISLCLLIFLSLTYVVLCAISFVTYDVSYSTPIYVQPLTYTLIFIVPIIICLLTFIIFKKKTKITNG